MKTKTALVGFGTLFLCVSLLFSGAIRIVNDARQTRATVAEVRPVLIIDAGHGGEDGGATGNNGVLEKDLNLAVAHTLADLLRAAGFAVAETRTTDTMLYPAGTRAGHKKQQDLAARLAATERYPDCVLISIHMNTYPTADCSGLQVWYSPNNAASKVLAETIQGEVKARLQPENTRAVKAAGSNIYILHHATVPAVLVECGFLSTPAECEKLCDPDYQKEIALAVFCGISAQMRG